MSRAQLLGLFESMYPSEYQNWAIEQVNANLFDYGFWSMNPGYVDYVPDDFNLRAPRIVDKMKLVELLYGLLPKDHYYRRLTAPRNCRARDMSQAELARIAELYGFKQMAPGPHNQDWINAIFNANPRHMIFSEAPEIMTPEQALEELSLVLERKVIVATLMKRAEFLMRTAFPKSRIIDQLFFHFFSDQKRWSLRTPSRREGLFHMLEMLTLEQEHYGRCLEHLELEEAMKEAEAGANELGLL
jgi:hypothetical protein